MTDVSGLGVVGKSTSCSDGGDSAWPLGAGPSSLAATELGAPRGQITQALGLQASHVGQGMGRSPGSHASGQAAGPLPSDDDEADTIWEAAEVVEQAGEGLENHAAPTQRGGAAELLSRLQGDAIHQSSENPEPPLHADQDRAGVAGANTVAMRASEGRTQRLKSTGLPKPGSHQPGQDSLRDSFVTGGEVWSDDGAGMAAAQVATDDEQVDAEAPKPWLRPAPVRQPTAQPERRRRHDFLEDSYAAPDDFWGDDGGGVSAAEAAANNEQRAAQASKPELWPAAPRDQTLEPISRQNHDPFENSYAVVDKFWGDDGGGMTAAKVAANNKGAAHRTSKVSLPPAPKPVRRLAPCMPGRDQEDPDGSKSWGNDFVGSALSDMAGHRQGPIKDRSRIMLPPAPRNRASQPVTSQLGTTAGPGAGNRRAEGRGSPSTAQGSAGFVAAPAVKAHGVSPEPAGPCQSVTPTGAASSQAPSPRLRDIPTEGGGAAVNLASADDAEQKVDLTEGSRVASPSVAVTCNATPANPSAIRKPAIADTVSLMANMKRGSGNSHKVVKQEDDSSAPIGSAQKDTSSVVALHFGGNAQVESEATLADTPAVTLTQTAASTHSAPLQVAQGTADWDSDQAAAASADRAAMERALIEEEMETAAADEAELQRQVWTSIC